MVAAAHPGPGKCPVVDDPDLAIPVEDVGDDIGRDATLTERGLQLRPGTRSDRQQTQADLPGTLAGVPGLRGVARHTRCRARAAHWGFAQHTRRVV
jgi:hypothetical protein